MTEATPKKPKKAPGAKAAPDAQRLGRLAGEIAELLPTRMTDLVHRLETEERMKLTKKGSVKGAVHLVALAGLSAAGPSPRVALENWASAARRTAAGAA